MLDFPAELSPPVPVPRAQALGPIALLRVLADNPIEAWTAAHFEQPRSVASCWKIVTTTRKTGYSAVFYRPG